MSQFDFLVELGTEELPPKALKSLSESFRQAVEQGIAGLGLKFNQVTLYAAPRRMAILIKDLQARQPDEEFEKRGPAIHAAFDGDGNPSKAASGFARSCGVDVNELEQLETDKGSWLVHRGIKPGQATQNLLPDLISGALDQLPIPKRMRWGANRFEFVRPVKWLVMLANDQIIPAAMLGVESGNQSRGHRFHAPDLVTITKAADYAEIMRTAYVIASFDERRELIRTEAQNLAKVRHLHAVIEDDLLDEVTALNEWPVTLIANFEPRFLDVPAEALISSMAEHQKYFHVLNDKQEIQPHFIFVANIESKDPAQVIAGNEKVIRPRLSDAAFFWETDKKTALASRVDGLDRVMFQKELGSIGDKVRRITAVAGNIAKSLGQDAGMAERAATLAKADLLTDMVFEFTDLQGIAGTYYARNDGEPDAVADAIAEHYMPAGASDSLPASETGIAVALADRLDNLTGLFGIGQPPTGNRDPFALRRAALGVLRILVDKQVNLDLTDLLDFALAQHLFDEPVKQKTRQLVLDYLLDRFTAWYTDAGIAVSVVQAVRSQNITHPMDFDSRVRAVHSFSKISEAEALAAANKRVSNLLAKAEQTDIKDQIDESLLAENAEIALHKAISQAERDLLPLAAKRDYQACLTRLASLREAVDTFFDQVMVNADDKSVRINRLSLLKQLRNLFLQVADISHLS